MVVGPIVAQRGHGSNVGMSRNGWFLAILQLSEVIMKARLHGTSHTALSLRTPGTNFFGGGGGGGGLNDPLIPVEV